jgi:predicted nuclease of predicted toxin-antitoxin system
MKLKLDENLGRSVAELFRQAGHDTTTVRSAVGIIDVVRDEQTGVRVNAHAASVALLLPRKQDQVGEELVAISNS